MSSNAMHLHVLPAGPIQTNAYLLTAPSRREAILVDAPGDIWPELQSIIEKEDVVLKELWLTHGHWDHVQGAAEVVRQTQAVVKAHAADRVLIETPEVMRAFLSRSLSLEPVKVNTWLQPGDAIDALGRRFEVRHVPGHCPGNLLFYLPSASMAFVGDALFAGSVGRTDLPGGDADQLARSIRTQIYTLPDDTQVYPGHGPATTVGQEKISNPFVRA